MEPCSLLIGAGVVAALAIAKRAAWRRRVRWGGGHYGRFAMAGCGPSFGESCGPGFVEGDGPELGRERGRWGGGGRGFFVRRLLSHLNATPAQEKELRAALGDLESTMREAKTDLQGSRANLAHAITGEIFDEMAMGEAAVSVDKASAKVKEAVEAALRRVHATLDAKQRERFAALVEDGPLAGRWGGPYRS